MLKQINLQTILTLIGVCLLVVLLLRGNNNKADAEEYKQLIEALSAQVETWRDEQNLQRAKIEAIATRDPNTFLTIKTDNPEILLLQKVVDEFKDFLKEQGNSATVFDSNTSIEDTSKTVVTLPPEDSAKGKDVVYPTYSTKVDKEGWITGTAVADKEKFILDLDVKNQYSVVNGVEKTKKGIKKWFEKGKPFSEVKNYNPYSETSTLRTYNVSGEREKRFGIGPNFSYSINSKLERDFSIGVGLHYSIFKF